MKRFKNSSLENEYPTHFRTDIYTPCRAHQTVADKEFIEQFHETVVRNGCTKSSSNSFMKRLYKEFMKRLYETVVQRVHRTVS